MATQVPSPTDYHDGTAAGKVVTDVRTALADKEVKDVITDVPALIKETKAGYKTTEFWLTLAGLAAVNLNGIVMTLPDKYQAIGSATILGLYALSRGVAKKGIPSVEAAPEA